MEDQGRSAPAEVRKAETASKVAMSDIYRVDPSGDIYLSSHRGGTSETNGRSSAPAKARPEVTPAPSETPWWQFWKRWDL
jgi:hypothetical protein